MEPSTKRVKQNIPLCCSHMLTLVNPSKYVLSRSYRKINAVLRLIGMMKWHSVWNDTNQVIIQEHLKGWFALQACVHKNRCGGLGTPSGIIGYAQHPGSRPSDMQGLCNNKPWLNTTNPTSFWLLTIHISYLTTEIFVLVSIVQPFSTSINHYKFILLTILLSSFKYYWFSTTNIIHSQLHYHFLLVVFSLSSGG